MTDLRTEIDANQTGQARETLSSAVSVSSGPLRYGSRWGGLSLDPTSVLYVSLFLVLFAFFVVLNVNASEKVDDAEAVMASLQDAFSGEAGRLQPGQHNAHDLDPVLSTARKTVLSNIPQALVTTRGAGDTIEVSVPLASFFVRHTARLAPSRELFLKSLATLASAADHQPFAITVAFATDEADLDTQRRVAAIAAALGKYGVLPGKLTVLGTNVTTEQVRFVMSRG